MELRNLGVGSELQKGKVVIRKGVFETEVLEEMQVPVERRSRVRWWE